MTKVNQNFLKLPGSYLFSEVARRISVYSAAHPEAKIIKLSIGDVTRPLAPAVIEAMHQAVTEMGTFEGFHGVRPRAGLRLPAGGHCPARLRRPGRGHEARGDLRLRRRQERLRQHRRHLRGGQRGGRVRPGVPRVRGHQRHGRPGGRVPGRAGPLVQAGLHALCRGERLTPQPPKEKVDIIYLCFPNNPTGAVATKEQLKVWVDYANENGAVILYDSAYEAFITEDNIPHTIYEVEGARTCAIEFRSYSQDRRLHRQPLRLHRVPMELERDGAKLNALWNRRQCTKFNGVPYVVQRGAAAIYTPEGKEQTRASIAYYQNNAKVIRDGLTTAGLTCFGGVNAPYIWLKTPNGMAPGSSSTCCWIRPTWPPPPARASVPAARGTSASPPSATRRPPARPWSASRLPCNRTACLSSRRHSRRLELFCLRKKFERIFRENHKLPMGKPSNKKRLALVRLDHPSKAFCRFRRSFL